MVRNRGQSTVEITVLIAVVIGALLAMQFYMKRATMGKLRSASDNIGDQFNPSNTEAHSVNGYVVTKGRDKSDFDGSSASTSVNESQTRGGYEHVKGRLQDDQLF